MFNTDDGGDDDSDEHEDDSDDDDEDALMSETFDTPTFNTKEASKLVVFQNARIESSLLASEGMKWRWHAVSSIH